MLIDIAAALEDADSLEPLPPSSGRLMRLMRDPEWSLGDIEEVVRLDPALTAQLLRVANSTASGSARAIATVRDAVVRLGSGTVLGIAMAQATAKTLQRGRSGACLPLRTLWKHSVAALLAAEHLGRLCGVPPEAVTAGLLHDVGKLLLHQHTPEKAWTYVRQAQRVPGMLEPQAELEIFEVHHGELGGLMAQRWELPQAIVTAIAYHHTPEAPEAEACRLICRTTYLAEQIACRIDAGVEEEAELDTTGQCETVARAMGLGSAELDAACTHVRERLAATLAAYG